jgi:hypothetical protein
VVPPLGSVELRPALLLYRISRPLHRNSQPKIESLLPVSACDHGRPEGSLRRRDGGGEARRGIPAGGAAAGVFFVWQPRPRPTDVGHHSKLLHPGEASLLLNLVAFLPLNG